MPANNFLTFASANGALVQTDAAYASDPARQSGFQNGVADPAHVNKAWRQGAAGSALAGQVIVDHANVDANDDGDIPTLKANWRRAMAQMLSGVYFAQDTSTIANTITATLDPAPVGLGNFRAVYIRIANTNTGPTTLNLAPLGAKTATRHDGSALQAKDLPAGQIAHFLYDGALGQFVLAGLAAGETQRVVAGPVLWVRPDGNDATADGSSPTTASAFQTIAAAANYGMSRFSLAGTSLTIRLGYAGTDKQYAAPGTITGTGQINIVGDPNNQSAYLISGIGPAGGGGTLISAAGGCQITTSGFSILNTGTINGHLGAGAASGVTFDHITFQTSVSTGQPCVLASVAGSVICGAGNIFNGYAGAAFLASSSGSVLIANNVTVQSTPTYSAAFAVAISNGSISVSSGVSIVGSATGQRYSASLNGTINTLGGGANFFPGTGAGALLTGGQYN